MPEDINILDVLHDINIGIVFSGIIDDKACGDFADIMRKVTDKYGLTDKYKEYINIKFGGLPPTPPVS